MTLQAWSEVADPVAGEGVSATDYGIPVLLLLDRLHALEDQVFYIPLNGATPLVTGDKQYWRVPAKFDSGTLVAVAACCKVGSTSGAVTLTVNNGATSMLSTNITLDQNETDTLTAAVPAVIDGAQDDLATGDLIELGCTAAGASVTYCAIELTIRPSA
jgi:hypothetical protein